MSTRLVNRLREYTLTSYSISAGADYREAADTIERLQQELAEARKLLADATGHFELSHEAVNHAASIEAFLGAKFEIPP